MYTGASTSIPKWSLMLKELVELWLQETFPLHGVLRGAGASLW